MSQPDKTIHRKFVQALPSDNPYLSQEYIGVLKETFAHRPELLEAYLYGSWDALEGADQIIKAMWLREAAGKTIHGWAKRPRLACDTAGFGDDETVIMYSEITDIEEQWIMPHCDFPVLVDKLAQLSVLKNNCPIALEQTGADIGFCATRSLSAQGKKIIVYTPQGKSSRPNMFYNLRSEIWSSGAERLSRGQVQLKMESIAQADRDKLIRQLCTPKYKYRHGKTLVEPKADIKARSSGESPDRGDCYMILLWSYEKAPATNDFQPYQEDISVADSYAAVSVI